MAVKCSHCRGTDIGYGFDTYQCFSCGGYTNWDGTPTVPTCAVEVEGAVYEGPGKHLLEGSDPPVQATTGKVK